MTAKHIAYFVTPHGFGHAARAVAVMEALADIDPAVQFEIFTTVPSWFFQDSLGTVFNYHHLETDVGLVQKSAFQADLDDTLRSLSDFYPLASPLIAQIAETLDALNCHQIICDIAPMGILVAKKMGIPSILVENFTWDWLYQQYTGCDSRINRYIDYLAPVFKSVNYHIQTEPVCNRFAADLSTAPVSRKIKTGASEVRKRLALPPAGKMVLITTGGIPQTYEFLDRLTGLRDISFVMPGAGPQMKIIENLIILPHRSDFYHPDLVSAADAVIGKVGYSTLAEIYHGGIPFGYVARSDFRESESMVEFIQTQMPGIAVDESEFASGDWTGKIEDLLELAPVQRNIVNGAVQIGRFIKELME